MASIIRPYGLGHDLLALGQAGVMNKALHSDQEWEAFASGLGQQLQRARIAKGLSQEQVAYRAKLSRYTYQKYERGFSRPGEPANPSVRSLLALAQVLEVDLSELIPAVVPDLTAS